MMKVNFRKAIATLALSVLAVAAFAQTGPPMGGPPDGPDGGPRQGPGGGPGRRPGPPHDGGMRMLLSPRVVAELKLTDDQVAKIRALAPAHPGGPEGPEGPRGEHGRDRGPGADRNGGPGGPPPSDDRGEAGRPPERGARPDGPEEKLRTILNADQLARFRQLRLQREGVRAIHRPDVAKELGLTEEQLEALRPTPPQGGERPDPKQEEARILKSLSKAQREKWKSMLGRPFDFGKEEPRPGDAPPAPPQGEPEA